MKLLHLVLGAGMLASGWMALFADKSPTQGIAEPVARAAASSAARPSKAAALVPTAAADILALRPRGEVNTELPPRQLFAARSWVPAALVAPRPAAAASDAAASVAPPLPYTYIGKKSQDGVWEVYLARQELALVVRERDVLQGTYRVDAIGSTSMSLTYLPLNQLQRLSLGPNY